MGATNTMLLAMLVTGASSLAEAAELPMPPAPPIAVAVLVADFGGWYLRGDVGVGAVQAGNFHSTIEPGYANGAFVLPNGPIVPAFAAVGDSALFDFGFGYQFNSWLRGDLTGEYRSEATYRRGISTAWWTGGGVGTNYDSYSAGLSTALFMANGYVDIGTWRGVTPYIHAGVGLASHNFQGLNDSAALWPWPPIRPISPGRSAPASRSASRRTSRSTSAIVTSTWAASGAIASNTASTSPASTSGIGSTSPRTTFA